MTTNMPVYYRNKKTGEIEAKYVGCDTLSTVFRNEELYERFESPEDLPLEVVPAPTPARLEVPGPPEKKKPLWRRILHL